MAKKGKLIGIGVGPGDTELLTLKAAKVLKSVPVVFSPKSSKEKESIALSIVKPILEERKDYKRLMLVEPIFPMIEDKKELEKIWTSASEMIAQYLDSIPAKQALHFFPAKEPTQGFSGSELTQMKFGCGFHRRSQKFFDCQPRRNPLQTDVPHQKNQL